MTYRRLVALMCLVSTILLSIVLHASAVEDDVGFIIAPMSSSVSVGSFFNVTFQVKTMGQSIDGAEIHFDYDPMILEITSIVPGRSLPLQLLPAQSDNTMGKLDYAAGTLSNFPQSTFDLVTITFKAKKSGSAVLRIPISDVPRHSDITFAGTSLINFTAPVDLGTITITGDSTPIEISTQTPVPVGATLIVRTESGDTSLGQVVNIHLELKQIANLYGLDIDCNVNPAILVGVEHVDGTVFKSKNSFFVDQGFQPDGHWKVAASLLKPAPAYAGNGSGFNLRYKVAGVGTTQINCVAMAVNASGFLVPITVVNGAFSNETVPSVSPPIVTVVPAVTSVPTRIPTLVAAGSNAPQSNTVQGVIIDASGSNLSGIKVTLLSGGTAGIVLGQTETNSDGTFQFDNFQPGIYTLQVTGDGYIEIDKSFSVAADGSLPLQIRLSAGDTNGDQQIDLTDAALIGANFYLSVPPSPTSADLNHDGVINISDLVLVGANFGLTGPINE